MQRLQHSIVVETDVVAREERMALAGQLHVELRCSLIRTGGRCPGRQRSDGGKGLACVSLPPKPPPMRRQRHTTWCAWKAEHVRDDRLGFARVLGGRHDLHQPSLSI
jgi:hypothetical protein